MYYAKIIERQTYNYIQNMNVDHLNEEERNALTSDGWSEVKFTNEPIVINEEYFFADISITYTGEGFIGEHVKILNRDKCESDITKFKQQLADTDYKVVKNMEYQMAMMTSVETNMIILDLYDAQELHNERQAVRNKINELENLLKE